MEIVSRILPRPLPCVSGGGGVASLVLMPLSETRGALLSLDWPSDCPADSDSPVAACLNKAKILPRPALILNVQI